MQKNVSGYLNSWARQIGNPAGAVLQEVHTLDVPKTRTASWTTVWPIDWPMCRVREHLVLLCQSYMAAATAKDN